jgi:hypothetical protein
VSLDRLLGETLGYAPTVGASFLVLDNDGSDPIAGTFAGLPEGKTFAVGGKYLKISYVGGTGNDVVLTAVVPPPLVSSLSVNGGGVQRSKVNSLVVTFDQAVTLAAGAFELLRRDGAAIGTTPAVGNPSLDGRTYVLTFSGPKVVGGSLADGVYDVRIVAANVHAGGVNMAADAAFEFHRLFGDANGDGDSDNGDAVQMGRTYNLDDEDDGFLWNWDYNGDVVQVGPRRTIQYKGY